jgi:hypothetical protein
MNDWDDDNAREAPGILSEVALLCGLIIIALVSGLRSWIG